MTQEKDEDRRRFPVRGYSRVCRRNQPDQKRETTTIEDTHHTRRSYLNAVTGLAKHYRKSPETITVPDAFTSEFLA